MHIAKPKPILDPYTWLPGYGESSVSFHSSGSDLVLEIEYDGKDSAEEAQYVPVFKRELTFKRAHNVIKTLFPGHSIFTFACKSADFSLGDLTEFQASDWLKNTEATWRAISSHQPPPLRHFFIVFLSENLAFHVLAEDVRLSDPVAVA